MGRRGSFLDSVMREAVRASRRAAAENQRRGLAQQRQQYRAQIQAEREGERSRIREEKQRFLEEREEEAGEKTNENHVRIAEFKEILKHTLSIDDAIDFSSLRTKDTYPLFSLPPEIAKPKDEPKKEDYLSGIKPQSILKKAIPGSAKRHQSKIDDAEAKYQEALGKHNEAENQRKQLLDNAKKEYEASKARYDIKKKETNLEVDKFEANYKAGDHSAITDYFTMVLERSIYPGGFPQEFRIAFVPESKQVVVDYELPKPDIIPEVLEYRYVKSKDIIEEKPRKPAEIKELYQDIVSSITLRSCHELFESDQAHHIDVAVFNGFVQTIDASTGKDIRPCLISVRMTRENYENIDLSRVDKKACLRNLGATVSPRPYEVQPVKPIIEFDMVDKRFVEQSDVLSDLESRPNLMDLNPFEFENLVSNLFSKLGLDTKQTRSSRDGGVDAVAFDLRPVIGGKVVIQAKRYKNTVGVSAVRDLYGTMMNEGANKGILVTTSGYGPDAFEFAKDKPIELMDGGQLLYLLDQIGVKARIIFPEEWKGN